MPEPTYEELKAELERVRKERDDYRASFADVLKRHFQVDLDEWDISERHPNVTTARDNISPRSGMACLNGCSHFAQRGINPLHGTIALVEDPNRAFPRSEEARRRVQRDGLDECRCLCIDLVEFVARKTSNPHDSVVDDCRWRTARELDRSFHRTCGGIESA